MHVFPDVIDFAVGIDNGLVGAMAVVRVPHGTSASVTRTPTVKDVRIRKVMTQKERSKQRRGLLLPKGKTSRNYDFLSMIRICAVLRRNVGPSARIVAVMEAPQMRRSGGMAESNQATLRSMQHGQTCWQQALAFSGISLFEVPAATWKSDLKLTRQGKEASLRLAKQLFPRSATDDDDECEAMLLAHWLATRYSPSILRL